MMNYRADKHTFELSEAEWNDSREAIAERDALLEDNERLRVELATVKDELDQQKKYTKSAVKYAEMMDDADTATNEMVDKLQAEIAAIRPNWDDAPEWAEWHIIEACYYDKYMESADTVRIKEYRPEE